MGVIRVKDDRVVVRMLVKTGCKGDTEGVRGNEHDRRVKV
jgi:hypothetical protein